MRSRRWLKTAGTLALALLLSGSYCSWRGYYVPGGLQNTASVISVGPVGGFASVFVNGSEFADSGATVTIDGAAGSESELLVGQLATVSAAPGSGSIATASAIATTTKLVGPVTAIDLGAATVTVLGQTVTITGDTSIASGVGPTDAGGLAVGAIVAIDGYRTSTGLIASRFDLAAAGRLFQVAGPVANLNTAAQTFSINGTAVNYSSASGGLPAQLADGSYVVATGSTLLDSVTLSASQVTAQAEVPLGASGASGTVHGAVTRFGSASDFDVGGQTVATTSTTSFINGVSGDVAPDVELEVAGSYDSSGNLTATTVTLAPAANVRVAGPVQSLDTVGSTLTVAGITIGTDAETRWDDRGPTLLRTFAFANLSVGDWVIARGVASSTPASASAHVLERYATPSPATIELQDVAGNVANPTFTLTGITVSAVGATFTDVNGASLTPAGFFGQANGRLVRARGALSASGVLVAATVALRD